MQIQTSTLRDKAVAVKLVRKMFNPVAMDKSVTTNVDKTEGTVRAGRYMKRRLKECSELQAAQRAFADVYTYVRDNSLPWMDDGVRVVPNANYTDFALGYKDRASKAMDAVKALGDVWDQAVLHDQTVLKGMWDPNDYPSKEEMLDMWQLRLLPMPIPSSADFRIDMDETDKMFLDEQVAKVEADATTYVMKELLTPIKNMAERLSATKGEKGAIFRNTLVSNVTDACERAKKLNINNDERINEAVNEVTALLDGLSPEDLRESDALRAHVGKKMTEMENKMASWF